MRLCMRCVNPGGVSVPCNSKYNNYYNCFFNVYSEGVSVLYNGKYDQDYCFFEVDVLKISKYLVLSRRYRKTT